jgi:tricorn protease
MRNHLIRLYGLFAGLLVSLTSISQIDAGLFRYPDVSSTQIVFSYANDLWVVSRNGGEAVRLSSPPGQESFPKFSRDGKKIAFTGNYDGNSDIYVIPVSGGEPLRLTYHDFTDRVVSWTNDGRKILFASTRESGKYRFNQFYTISATGGNAEKLPLPYAEFGSYSPDGKRMALTFRSQAFRNWKRYRGGWNAEIYLYDFAARQSENISAGSMAADEFPMWHKDQIYFITDRGKDLRMNLWRYDLKTKKAEQLTFYKDFDIHFPSLGPDDIVYEQGGKLHLFNLSNQKDQVVEISLVTDQMNLKPRMENVQSYIQNLNLSPDGKRVLVEARGDIFSLPAAEGVVRNLTMSPGSAERYPSWSPDGSRLAWWSDASGEYELMVRDLEGSGAADQITNFGPGFRYQLFWSPDSRKIAFIDKANQISIIDVFSRQVRKVDKALSWMYYQQNNYKVSWSPDSRYLAYHRDLPNSHQSVFIYDLDARKSHPVTSGYYSASSPVFDPGGKYLFLLTSQSFQPMYSNFDNSFIYANATQIAAISLSKSTPSLLAPKNDTVAVKKKDQDKNPKADSAGKKTAKPEKAGNESKKEIKSTQIDFDGLEDRMNVLPPSAGNLGYLEAAKDKLYYIRYANTGDNSTKPSIKFFDLDKKEEKTILNDAGSFILSEDQQKMLVNSAGRYAVINPTENAKIEKSLPVENMVMQINPREEWQQMFTEAWRLQRDYFYDPHLHGVNWNQVRSRYTKMLNGAVTREDVNFVIGEMIGELNASHTYQGGGDLEKTRKTSVGYLGVDWQADGKFYRIARIVRGAPWDAEARSPLAAPGINIPEGSYILSVNGVPITTDTEPYAAFAGLAGKTVEITYNSVPVAYTAKTAVVQTMSNEYRLRNLAWIESNRKRVEQATEGQVGYVYVPSTGVDGQTELLRQLNAQTDKKALIIDERFNDGGQIPDRFIEMLDRKPLAYWATRDGVPWSWPPSVAFGPKVMLINGWSGSGGDAFPDYFRKRQLGPLIGSRTWGGLIGISGAPPLIDGGSVSVPTFRMYDNNGWFKEGHGVDPDIAVPEDLGMMARGKDPQLEKAIEVSLEQLKTKGYKAPPVPTYENR